MSGKSTKDVTTSCQESAHQQELFRFVSVVPESEQPFSGVGIPLAASLGGLGLICGVVSVITAASAKKGFSESDETRKNCFCLRVKN